MTSAVTERDDFWRAFEVDARNSLSREVWESEKTELTGVLDASGRPIPKREPHRMGFHIPGVRG